MENERIARLEERVSEIRDDVREMKSDLKGLLSLKWRLMGMAALIAFAVSFLAVSAHAGYYPWGWQGWLQSVATITDAPSSGALTGSVVFAQDTDALYYWDGSEWTELSGGGGGSGTVTSVSVASANGFAGTVADATTTPAITMETSITGLLHGNGTAVAAETVSSPLNESSGTLSCLTASGSQAGCLSSTDWATFNGKQSTLTFSDSLVNSGGTVTLSGDTASPGDSQYYGTDSGGTLGYFDLPGSGVTTVGTFGSQSSAANGAVISGSDIYFQDFTSSNPGMAPASGGGTTNFLRADGSWAAPSGGGGTPGGSSTDVQYNSSGSFGGDSGMIYDGSGGLTMTAKMSSASANISGLTDSEAVFTDGSDNLVSKAITGTGNVVMSTSPTLVTPALGTPSSGVATNLTGLPLTTGVTGILPIANGGTDVSSVTTTPTASSFAGWDANSNLSANAMVQAYATTATAAGTTTLTVASAPIQYFTGTTTQTIVLPVVSTLPQTGFTYSITNNSTGLLTVESSGGNTITTVDPAATVSFTAILLTGTSAASWNAVIVSSSANVTSSGSGQYHTEGAQLKINQTDSSVISQTGNWIAYSSYGSAITTFTFNNGEFSETPYCTCTVSYTGSLAGNLGLCQIQSLSSSGFGLLNSTVQNGGIVAEAYASTWYDDVVCIGPH